MPGCTKLKKVTVYNDNIDYYYIVPTVYYGDGTIGYNVKTDSEAFRNCSEDLILCGSEGSTTQNYAQQKGIKFEKLSSRGEEPPTTTKGSIHLNKNKLELKENETEILTVSFLEMSSDTKVIWSSSDENVAIVENGKVTAENIGNTIITVSTEDGQYKDTCTVSVIKKETSIEEGKKLNEKNWLDTIKLSELKESEIYRYTANATTQFPKIENDIGKNCLIYIKGRLDDDYEKEISMYKTISSSAISASFDEYNSGESFCIMYEKIGNNELLKLIQNDEIIYLSNYNNGDELEYQFEKYIYNDTEKDITINIKNKAFGVEISDSVIIPKGEIYGFDWMIDSAIISYSGNINNDENDNQEQEEKPDKEQNDDNTQSTEKLPQTGGNTTIIFITLLVIIIAILTYKKYYKFKNIG